MTHEEALKIARVCMPQRGGNCGFSSRELIFLDEYDDIAAALLKAHQDGVAQALSIAVNRAKKWQVTPCGGIRESEAEAIAAEIRSTLKEVEDAK